MAAILGEVHVVIEYTDDNYSVYVPELPGCVSIDKTVTDVKRNIDEAIELHIEGLEAEGSPVPPPGHHATYLVEEPQTH